MPKVALVETKPSRTNFSSMSLMEHLILINTSSVQTQVLKKYLKRDCDIEIDTDNYDWVVLVGSDALKYFTKINSVTEYSGKKVEDKFLPVINPAMLKPLNQKLVETWDDRLKKILLSTLMVRLKMLSLMKVLLLVYRIRRKQKNGFVVLEYSIRVTYIALDSETTGLYPRNGHMIGISLCLIMGNGSLY